MEIKLPPAAEQYLAYVEMERYTERMRFFAETYDLAGDADDASPDAGMWEALRVRSGRPGSPG